MIVAIKTWAGGILGHQNVLATGFEVWIDGLDVRQQLGLVHHVLLVQLRHQVEFKLHLDRNRRKLFEYVWSLRKEVLNIVWKLEVFGNLDFWWRLVVELEEALVILRHLVSNWVLPLVGWRVALLGRMGCFCSLNRCQIDPAWRRNLLAPVIVVRKPAQCRLQHVDRAHHAVQLVLDRFLMDKRRWFYCMSKPHLVSSIERLHALMSKLPSSVSSLWFFLFLSLLVPPQGWNPCAPRPFHHVACEIKFLPFIILCLLNFKFRIIDASYHLGLVHYASAGAPKVDGHKFWLVRFRWGSETLMCVVTDVALGADLVSSSVLHFKLGLKLRGHFVAH